MEPREMSESNQNLEKDVTLEAVAASQPAPEDAVQPAETAQPEVEPVAEVPEEAAAPEELAAEVAEEVAAPEEPAAEVAEEAAAPEELAAEAAEEATPKRMLNYSEMTKAELLEAMATLLSKPAEAIRDEMSAIKAAFYNLHNAVLAQLRADFVAQGNNESDFVAPDDPEELRLKDLLNELREKRAQFLAEQEAQRAANLEKKREIIAQIVAITNDPDNVNKEYSHVQQLQQQFKEAGPVPATAESELWASYQKAIENFYDLLKMNKELRDYDFKKNLELKQQLCAEAEALDDMPDVLAAFRRLQELHNSWREVGPVAKELRDEIWARFKAASAVINKKHQDHFDALRGREKENEQAKTTLCEQIEQVSTEGLASFSAWDALTKQIIALQEQWRKVGPASRAVNNQLYARFRKKCDEFFEQKNEFFKRRKEEFSANLAKKIALCEQAEALKESTEWNKGGDLLASLQQQWKEIGPVAKRHSDLVWKRFLAACHDFYDRRKAYYEQRRAAQSATRSVEMANLKAKREVTAEIERLVAEAPADAPQQVRDLMDRWQEIGHVPYREKETVYLAYRAAVDKAFEQLDMRGSRARMSRFEQSVSQMGAPRAQSERERLVRAYEQKRAELKTCENNLSFFTAKTKTGGEMLKEMKRKLERLRTDIDELEQKIRLIDEKGE